jgi:hypothetical protein
MSFVSPTLNEESWITKVKKTAPKAMNTPAIMASVRVEKKSLLPLAMPAFSTRTAI